MSANLAMQNGPVLFVDDDELFALLVRQAWAKLATNVPLEWLNDGKVAVSYLDSLNPVPRMILTDLNMPGINGFELLTWARGQPAFKDLPIILLSGSATKEDVAEAYARGADFYLEKPRGLDELSEMLRSLDRFWLEVPRH